jgi:hypothetical protein
MAGRLHKACTATLVAVAAAACASSGTRSDPASPAATTREGVTASDEPAQRPAGAAIAAALAYVASTDTLMAHSPIGRGEILERLVLPRALDEQAEALDEATAEMAKKLGVPVEGLAWVEAPLSATVTESSPTTATVAVWTVSVYGAPAAGSPQQVWRTVHVELVLADGGWLVAAAGAEAGPTPASNELMLQASFEDFDEVASWTPVVQGVEP